MSGFPSMEDHYTPSFLPGAPGRVPQDQADIRPLEVEGPFGRPMSIVDLPPPDTRRWVVRRKAEVLAAIRGGLLTAAEACQRYRLSPEELDLWQESLERAGVPGLRVTRIQLYRDYPPSAPAPSARPVELDPVVHRSQVRPG